MILDIWENINKVADNFKDWIIEHSTSPILWVGLFFLGILIPFFIYFFGTVIFTHSVSPV